MSLWLFPCDLHFLRACEKLFAVILSWGALMTDKVAHTAGLIWQTLNDKGPLKFTALQKQTKVPAALLHMGLGWLAREDKIEMTASGRTFLVQLK